MKDIKWEPTLGRVPLCPGSQTHFSNCFCKHRPTFVFFIHCHFPRLYFFIRSLPDLVHSLTIPLLYFPESFQLEKRKNSSLLGLVSLPIALAISKIKTIKSSKLIVGWEGLKNLRCIRRHVSLPWDAFRFLSKGLVPFTQLVKVRRGKLVLALPSIRFSWNFYQIISGTKYE